MSRSSSRRKRRRVIIICCFALAIAGAAIFLSLKQGLIPYGPYGDRQSEQVVYLRKLEDARTTTLALAAATSALVPRAPEEEERETAYTRLRCESSSAEMLEAITQLFIDDPERLRGLTTQLEQGEVVFQEGERIAAPEPVDQDLDDTPETGERGEEGEPALPGTAEVLRRESGYMEAIVLPAESTEALTGRSEGLGTDRIEYGYRGAWVPRKGCEHRLLIRLLVGGSEVQYLYLHTGPRGRILTLQASEAGRWLRPAVG